VERQLARLRARYHERARELASIGFMTRGSILQVSSRCGSPGCACHDDPPRLHGPYWQWTRKVKAKTVTRHLTEAQVERYREWIENGKRFDEIVAELQDISAEADAILVALERPDRAPERRGAKKKRIRESG
jgi:hypothetical protein